MSGNENTEKSLFDLPAAALGRMIARTHGKEDDSDLARWAAILCAQLLEGRVFVDIKNPFEGLEAEGVKAQSWPGTTPDWVEEVDAGTAAVGGKPLVLVRNTGRLWLARYYDLDCRLRQLINARKGKIRGGLDELKLKDHLKALFPAGAGKDNKDLGQLIASANLVDLLFGLLTGGPGTGKTTSLAKLLLLYLGQEKEPARMQPILLLAPTGKAAARLKQSLSEMLIKTRKELGGRKDLVELINRVDPGSKLSLVKTQTIHSALRVRGARREGQGPFWYDAGNRLKASIVIVDEVSMVDLALMARLVEAVPDKAPLLLVGDAEQLESVEAGSVLPEIDRQKSDVPDERVNLVSSRIGITREKMGTGNLCRSDHVRLTYNHRFAEGSPIGPLSVAVNSGESDRFIQLISDCKAEEKGITWFKLPEAGRNQPAGIKDTLLSVNCYGKLNSLFGKEDLSDPGKIVKAYDGFRVLCAVRKGPDGVERWNDRLQKWVVGALHDGTPRAVMVTVNDPVVELCNGDTGLVLPTQDGSPRFHSSDGRVWPASLLPPNEPGWAVTIHKSQGSEYDTVAIVLPRKGGEHLMTRRLLYTALTRARKKVILIATEQALRKAIRDEMVAPT